MTRAGILAVVARLYTGEDSDEEVIRLLGIAEDTLPNSGICDLVFRDMNDLTPDLVAHEFLQRDAERRG